MAATIITGGMTSDQFVNALNGNFHSAETTITTGQLTGTLITNFNANYEKIKTSIPGIASKSTLSIGMSGSDYINTINQNYAKIDTVISNSTNDLNLMTLTDDGTKSPATETNEYLDKYMAFKLGGLIQYSIWSYSGLTFPVTNYYVNMPIPPTSFYNGTHDIAKWVSDAADAGIEYLVLSVLDGSQFALFDNPIRFPDYLLNYCYGYKKYDIASAGGDTAIVDKFYAACQLYGIEPIPYFNPIHGGNLWRNATNGKTLYGNYSTTQYNATERQYYENFYAKVMQYFLTTWPSNYLCLDVSGPMLSTMQMYYDAIKAINPNCIVISLTVGDNPFQWYPYDIGSNEENYSLTALPPADKTWADVLSSVRVHGGTTYYIPQEILSNNYPVGHPFYYHGDYAFRTQASIQDIYDIAKANSVPFCLNLSPNRTGIISAEQYNFFKNLTL